MKKLISLFFALLFVSFPIWGNSIRNDARDGNRIWLDSKEFHQGEFCWKMIKAGEVKSTADEISSLEYDTHDWITAIVPGTVLNSLVYNKVYPEPYYGVNNKIESGQIPDISKVGCEFYTYWFRTEFDVPESFAKKTIWLQPEGINYRAEIWVNGNLLSTMKGMFTNDYINVTDIVKVGQKNVLAIKVYPVDMPGSAKPKNWGAVGEFHNGGNGNIGLNTTMLMTVGWDFTFMDGIRDRNTGIWKSISLYTTGKLAIRHPFIKSELSKPGYDESRESISVEVVNPTNSMDTVKCVVRGEIVGENIVVEKPLRILRGEETTVTFSPEEFPQLIMSNPRLWWPVNKGPQNLISIKNDRFGERSCM
mgnify:FL=1